MAKLLASSQARAGASDLMLLTLEYTTVSGLLVIGNYVFYTVLRYFHIVKYPFSCFGELAKDAVSFILYLFLGMFNMLIHSAQSVKYITAHMPRILI